MKKEEFNKILEEHYTWLLTDGKKGKQANFRGKDLSHEDLTAVYLNSADITSAKLNDSDLKFANLMCADLIGTNLRNANLENANLHNSILTNTNLENAILKGADLRGANLKNANLRGADLTNADLSGADLNWVNAQDIKGYTVIAVQIDTAVKNNLISYWKELGIVTTGYFQGTIDELKEEVHLVHKNNPEFRERYFKAIKFLTEM